MTDEYSADQAVYLILRELGKLVGHELVPIGTSYQIWMTSKGKPNWDVVRAAIRFLDKSVLQDVEDSLLNGRRGRNQAQEILSIAYPRFRHYMCRRMWNGLFRVILTDKNADATRNVAPKKEEPDADRQELAQWLRHEMRLCKWKTKHDVARECGVNHKTVQRILDAQLVRDSSIEKIKSAISEIRSLSPNNPSPEKNA